MGGDDRRFGRPHPSLIRAFGAGPRRIVRGFRERSGLTRPTPRFGVLHPRPNDNHALGPQQQTFQSDVSSVAAQLAAGGYYAMARYARCLARAHDVSHGPRCPGPAGQSGDVPVGRHTPGRNSTDDRDDARGERRRARERGRMSGSHVPSVPLGRSRFLLSPLWQSPSTSGPEPAASY